MKHMEFGWKSVDSLLLPNKCIVTVQRMYTVTVAARKNALQHVSAASLALHAQNFARALEKSFVPKFTDRLSWTLHKICKCKGFLWATFSNIWTESKDIYWKICIIEHPYILIFYPVWRIFRKITHTQRRRRNTILKINNRKEVFS